VKARVVMCGKGPRRLLALLALALTLALPAAASAYSTAPGYSAADYATGFPFSRGLGFGPIGLAFDTSDNLYVDDPTNSRLYRFQPGGGVAGSDTQLTGGPVAGGIAGLAFSRGHLFLVRANSNDLVEIDQATGRATRTVVSGIACPVGLATDPASRDLFVSETCRSRILRISNPVDGPAQATTFASLPASSDGLAFAPDGTLYVVTEAGVVQVAGTASSTPGVTRSLATVPNGDGIAVGLAPQSGPPFLVVNRTDGAVTRLDLSKSPPEQSNVFTGGSRGDFVAVDSRGCLYITQTSSIVRIVPPGKHCDLTPSTPGAGTGAGGRPGIVVDTLGSGQARRCVVKRRLVVRVRQHGRVRLKFIRVYVNGRYRKTVRNRKVSAPIVIRHVPRGKFTVKLVARTTKGRKLTAKRHYRNCKR
jgi:hypothetical protein